MTHQNKHKKKQQLRLKLEKQALFGACRVLIREYSGSLYILYTK